ncbi:MAG: aspartyl/asparaginyl beta-hydroxylase domain-containing protein [Ignavibacteriales bacterium]
MTIIDSKTALRQAQAALMKRDAQGALAILRAAEARHPRDAEIKLQIALALRLAGDLPAAIDALDGVLALEPYHFPALLSKGALLERVAGPRAACTVYRHAVEIAPPPERLPPGLQAPLARAREVLDENARALEAFLRERVHEVRSAFGTERLTRFDEALGVFAGTKRIYQQQPLLLHYPQLPAIPFYDEALFPWLPQLEAATETIRDEMHAALETAPADFAPYIAYPPGVPVNQWGELNHSRRWSSFFLWRDGERQDGACAQCPRTAALLESLPMAHQAGYAPTAMFSVLEAHTHIPPHTGSSNIRLLVHLPLVLPGPARFRVGNEVREWRMGKAWVFDDTIEHEAWNDADELRVILIFDVWNPCLSEAERELITAMMAARREYYGFIEETAGQ